MPLYEYRCEGCSETFEVLQKFSDPPLTEHPGCGGAVTRLISAPTFQFKGTGWYVTDYAKGHDRAGRNGNGNGKDKDKAGAKPAETTASKPAESKPAGTADSASKH
jgi:putative FmdB family regulatory protein